MEVKKNIPKLDRESENHIVSIRAKMMDYNCNDLDNGKSKHVIIAFALRFCNDYFDVQFK